MPRRSSHFQEIPLNVTKRVTESGKKQMRECCIHFVGRQPLSADSVMGYALRTVQNSGIAEQLVRVMDEEEVLKFLQHPDKRDQVFGIFVLERFTGSIYEELRKRSNENPRCRVVGPVCILQADKNGELRIPFKPHPLLSLAMAGLTGITLSGDLDPDERRDLKQKIFLLGGQPLREVRPDQTSVVVGRSMLDERCVLARRLPTPIPIVRPEWVLDCYQQSQQNNIVIARDDYRRYLLPPFAGITITPAQIALAERLALQRGAATNGYTYLPDLDKSKTTHLVCEEAVGDKWTAARSWGLPCVRYSWVVMSTKCGYALPEQSFLVGPALTDEEEENRTQSLVNKSRYERKRSSKERVCEQDSHLTQDIRKFRRRSESPSRRLDGTQGLTALTQDLRMNDASQSRNSHVSTVLSVVETEPSFAEMYSHLLDESDGDVFDGLEIALVLCDAQKTAFLKKLIHKHSGYLHYGVPENAHRIVVGKLELDEEAKQLMERCTAKGYSGPFVNYMWLIKSAESDCLGGLDAEHFSFSEKRAAGDVAQSSAAAPEQPNLGFKVTKRDYSQRKACKNLLSAANYNCTYESITDDDLMNEYGRRSDSTQTVSRGDRVAPRAQEDDGEDMSLLDHSGWKAAGRGHGAASDSYTDRWDDVCSIVSTSSSLPNRPVGAKIPVVVDKSDMQRVLHKRPAAADRIRRAQDIHNVNTDHILQEQILPELSPATRTRTTGRRISSRHAMR